MEDNSGDHTHTLTQVAITYGHIVYGLSKTWESKTWELEIVFALT
jgi:hypothetical protein